MRLQIRRERCLIGLVGAALLAGCGGKSRPVRAPVPVASDNAAKCKVASSQSAPLVTEWAASEKANLESRLREGPVVVAYNGCEMRLLTQCRPKMGTYVWQRTTPGTDVVEIRNEDELYAKLPLGAASLEGELKSSGRLAIHTTISGQMKLTGLATADVPTDGDCAGATHVVSALSVGAFKLKSGGTAAIKGSVGVAGVGSSGGGTSSEEMLVREAGDPKKCTEATEEAPSAECRSPVQLFLWPLPKKPGAASEEFAGSDAIKVNFGVSHGADQWDVYGAGKLLCTTPCTKWVTPTTPIVFKPAGNTATSGDDAPSLRAFRGERSLDVTIKPPSAGALIGGTNLVIWGAGAAGFGMGMGLAGNGLEDSTKTTLFVVAGVGGAMIIGGIVLLANSGASFDIEPSESSPAARWKLGAGYLVGSIGRNAPLRFVVAPGFLSGSF